LAHPKSHNHALRGTGYKLVFYKKADFPLGEIFKGAVENEFFFFW
jgi:hypothetical protein